MYLCILLLIISSQPSLSFSQFPSPCQSLELPKHPSNWICTVHITVATFANATSSDITERFLSSNHGNIILTLSTMLNRSISILPVISFFESCTISILVESATKGSRGSFDGTHLPTYIRANKYAERGWRHSVIILLYHSCEFKTERLSQLLPHRLFYHSLDCGPQNTFPNHAFVPDRVQSLRAINDPNYTIHDRKLPSDIRRSISRPEYQWDNHDLNMNLEVCLAFRLGELSKRRACRVGELAVYHYEGFLNFTAVSLKGGVNYGRILTNHKFYRVMGSIALQRVDSYSMRIIYCDRKSDSPRLRPIHLLSPFSFGTWLMLAFLLICCAIGSSFVKLDFISPANYWSKVRLMKSFFNVLFDLVVCLLEQDLGKEHFCKIFIGLIVVYLGNDYKNYLTIDLVFPRAGSAVGNLTELLDLNFNIMHTASDSQTGINMSTWLRGAGYDLEIHDRKREKYVRDVDRWLSFVTSSDDIIKKLASETEKNALFSSAPYYIQKLILNQISEGNYPLSCHFVKRAFAAQFQDFYFFNPKAEEFTWWTAKFLDYGFFEFWKNLETQHLTIIQRKESLVNHWKRSDSSSTESFDLSRFIGQVHLYVFYTIISILTSICIAVFIFELATKNAQGHSFLVVKKFKRASLQLLWTFARSLILTGRLLVLLYETRYSL
jgi:hypothetical protein